MSLFRASKWGSCALALGLCLGQSRSASAQDSVVINRVTLPPVETHAFLEIYYRSGDPLIKDGYRLRKADLKFSGVVSPRLRWRISFVTGKALKLNTAVGTKTDSTAVSGVTVDQRSRMLQDAALTYVVNRYVGF